jgi:hypothetical protein
MDGDHLKCILRIYNKSTVPARSTVAIVRLDGFLWTGGQVDRPGIGKRYGQWHVVEPDNSPEQFAYAWLGDSVEVIHGPHWFRDLPSLSLGGFAGVRGQRMRIRVEAIAEGASVKREYQFRLVSAAEWVRLEV